MRLLNPITWPYSVLSAAALSFVAGCQGRGHIEVLEARLREQEDQAVALRQKLERQHKELVAARRLNETLNQKISHTGAELPPTDELERQHGVTGLKINSLLTGGVNRDGQPGDDQVTVVVTPVDHLGKPVQLTGDMQCVLIDPAQPEGEQRLGLWTFDESMLADAWTSSLGSAGYRLELPWQQAPTSRELELRVRMNSEHGDKFDASAKVNVIPPETL